VSDAEPREHVVGILARNEIFPPARFAESLQ
jgi:hypothetical protein